MDANHHAHTLRLAVALLPLEVLGEMSAQLREVLGVIVKIRSKIGLRQSQAKGPLGLQGCGTANQHVAEARVLRLLERLVFEKGEFRLPRGDCHGEWLCTLVSPEVAISDQSAPESNRFLPIHQQRCWPERSIRR